MAILCPVPTAVRSDADVIAASLTAPRSFTAVFERHFDVVHRYLRARVGAGLADDLAAETFIRAFEARERYDGSFADARPWLLAIATNLVRGHRRAEGRRLRAYARLDPREAAATFDGDAIDGRLDAGALGPAIGHALAVLRAADRDALLLIAWGDLTYEEAAGALAVPIGTVRSRVHRARAALRAALSDGEGGHDG